MSVSFNYWFDGEYRVITLAEGECAELSKGGEHEEGYSFTNITFTHEGDCIRLDSESIGTDCDGKHESYRTFTCPLDKLASHLTEHTDDSGVETEIAMTPDWQEVKENSRERDHFAESMNY